ncbi:hypothetical protein DICVIV_07405 [Dictyocaulus viviparus]|uniref:Uncharacterized protein n=1 Tax=Dictyocaulus viviparus TaxID=29172 RepID=A0A0D8XRW2_DICVI|nr:hypothetical protein DICVIV_07405 [Dictyocaulus viviparus]
MSGNSEESKKGSAVPIKLEVEELAKAPKEMVTVQGEHTPNSTRVIQEMLSPCGNDQYCAACCELEINHSSAHSEFGSQSNVKYFMVSCPTEQDDDTYDVFDMKYTIRSDSEQTNEFVEGIDEEDSSKWLRSEMMMTHWGFVKSP